jgi:hypothetical protein
MSFAQAKASDIAWDIVSVPGMIWVIRVTDEYDSGRWSWWAIPLIIRLVARFPKVPHGMHGSPAYHLPTVPHDIPRH